MGKLLEYRKKLNQMEKGKKAYIIYWEWMEFDGDPVIEFARLSWKEKKAWVMAVNGMRKPRDDFTHIQDR